MYGPVPKSAGTAMLRTRPAHGFGGRLPVGLREIEAQKEKAPRNGNLGCFGRNREEFSSDRLLFTLPGRTPRSAVPW